MKGLAQAREALAQAYAGKPEGPVFTALADVASTFNIPEAYFQDVIAGVEMDLTRHRYANFDELRTYCYRVASTVGLICIEVFGYQDARAKEYAVDLGLAMQITNIMRDIKEDAERGRIYLPQGRDGPVRVLRGIAAAWYHRRQLSGADGLPNAACPRVLRQRRTAHAPAAAPLPGLPPPCSTASTAGFWTG